MNIIQEKTMTAKELSEVAKCSPKTVVRAIAETFPELVKKGKTTKLTKSQAFDVMEKLQKMEPGQPRQKNVQVVQAIDKTMIAEIVGETVKQLTPVIRELLGAQSIQRTEKLALPELPPIDYRSELVSIIRKYGVKNDILYPQAWGRFYDRFNVRFHMNVNLRAQNEGISVIDWIERNGYIDRAYALGVAEFQ